MNGKMDKRKVKSGSGEETFKVVGRWWRVQDADGRKKHFQSVSS